MFQHKSTVIPIIWFAVWMYVLNKFSWKSMDPNLGFCEFGNYFFFNLDFLPSCDTVREMICIFLYVWFYWVIVVCVCLCFKRHCRLNSKSTPDHHHVSSDWCWISDVHHSSNMTSSTMEMESERDGVRNAVLVWFSVNLPLKSNHTQAANPPFCCHLVAETFTSFCLTSLQLTLAHKCTRPPTV